MLKKKKTTSDSYWIGSRKRANPCGSGDGSACDTSVSWNQRCRRCWQQRRSKREEVLLSSPPCAPMGCERVVDLKFVWSFSRSFHLFLICSLLHVCRIPLLSSHTHTHTSYIHLCEDFYKHIVKPSPLPGLSRLPPWPCLGPQPDPDPVQTFQP